MTYRHKLARRLAVLRRLPTFAIGALIAVSACVQGGEPIGPGAPTGPSAPLTPPPVAADSIVAISPANPVITTLSSVALRTYMKVPGGPDSVLVTDVDWSSTGGTIDSTGVFKAAVTGSYYVRATYRRHRSKTDSTRVVVQPAAASLVSVTVFPDSVRIQPGANQTFTATGRFSDATTGPVAVTWTASNGTILASGVYTAGSASGVSRVVATAATGQADTSLVTVAAPTPSVTLSSVAISPKTVTLQTRGTQAFSAVGRMSDGSTAPVSVQFSATGGSISAGGAYVAGSAAGSYRVIATAAASGKADTAAVQVTAPTVTAIVVSPITAQLQFDSTKQFTATATYSDGSTGAASVTWSATGGTISSSGLYKAGRAAGAFLAIATCSCGAADSSLVGVSAPLTPPPATPVLAAVVMSPSTTSLATGASQQFTAAGVRTDQSTAPVSITWSATGGTVTSGGLYTAGWSAGSFVVIARDTSGKADTASVAVSLAAPPSATGLPPEAPTGYTTLFDNLWDNTDSGPPTGWGAYEQWRQWGTAPNGTWTNPAYRSVVNDGTSPTGKAFTRFGWPTGSQYGSAFKMLHAVDQPYREVFLSTTIRFSPGWQHSAACGTKLFYWYTQETESKGQDNDMYVLWSICPGASSGRIVPVSQSGYVSLGVWQNAWANNRATTQVSSGQWVRVSVQAIGNSPGKSDGVLRWWINGVLQGEYTNVQYWGTTVGFKGWNYHWYWGVSPETKTQNDYGDLARVIFTGRN